MINYSSAGEWAQAVRALFMGETNENENAPLGDGGQAFGPGQQHPAFFSEWYGRAGFKVSTTDTLAVAQVKAAAAYLDVIVPELGLDLAVQGYQAGVEAVRQGVRNPAYLQRFTANLNKVRGSVNA